MANVLKVPKSENHIKCEQRQSKLAALAEKKAKGQFKLEDVDEKLDVIIEMLKEILAKY